ncbi:high-affinity branched-chain amino acid transport ATP-binding protein [Bordetella pertussis]|nr:high-affinity branched-chain amino acid transport ATP-binding protein [Bordetella pertussis]
MLKLENIHTYYGAIQALNGVSVEVKQGEIVTLIGANGAGKTTLLMTVCGNPRAREGVITFEGKDITHAETHHIMRSGIAISPEGRRVFKDLTVAENLMMGGFFSRREEVDAGLEHVYTLFPRLKERAGQRAGTMSGGEQQMLAIGRALVTNPRLLILDEATEGLAPKIREEIWTCLARLREAGQTILVIDKYVERLLGLADRHVILERGKVVWKGDSAALDADRGLWERYLGV